MNHAFAAILYATFLWWFSTGVIFYLNARPRHTFFWSMLGGTVVLVLALYGLWWSASLETVPGAFLAFTCGVLIWGWQTMSYFMGVITGPRRARCPADCRGWRHFFHAFESGLYHELVNIGTVALMVGLTWGKPNLFGLWTFLILWGMHVSAKLNVFLGVRNLNKEFIPEHLQYLTGFFRRRTMNLLFPLSVTAATIFTTVLVQGAMNPGYSAHTATGLALLATLMALAVLEHWFMILPIPADALWRWSIRSRDSDAARSGQSDGAEISISGRNEGTEAFARRACTAPPDSPEGHPPSRALPRSPRAKAAG